MTHVDIRIDTGSDGSYITYVDIRIEAGSDDWSITHVDLRNDQPQTLIAYSIVGSIIELHMVVKDSLAMSNSHLNETLYLRIIDSNTSNTLISFKTTFKK